MPETTYTYSVSTDFSNGVLGGLLGTEIGASSISQALQRIETQGDVCGIVFVDVLTSGDLTTLAGVIAAHVGNVTLVPDTRKNPGAIDGLLLTWLSNTTLSASTGYCRDSGDDHDITVDTPLSLDVTLVGAGGLDTGVITASTWYAVHVIIGPSQTPKLIGSLSDTNPLLPTGYSDFRRLGWIYTQSTGYLRPFIMFGNGRDRVVYYQYAADAADGSEYILFTGSPTGNNWDWQTLSIADFIPPTCREALLPIWYSSEAEVRFRIYNTGTVTASHVLSYVTSKQSILVLTDENQLIEWATGNSAGTVWIYCRGYMEHL